MTPAARRIISALILALWMVPGVGALGVGVHLALEQHGPHNAEHTLEIADLLQAAAHGHHHDAEAAPHHDHAARVDVPAANLRPGAPLVAVLPVPTSPEVALTERSLGGCFPKRGPPIPLFTANCTLLI